MVFSFCFEDLRETVFNERLSLMDSSLPTIVANLCACKFFSIGCAIVGCYKLMFFCILTGKFGSSVETFAKELCVPY